MHNIFSNINNQMIIENQTVKISIFTIILLHYGSPTEDITQISVLLFGLQKEEVLVVPATFPLDEPGKLDFVQLIQPIPKLSDILCVGMSTLAKLYLQLISH